MARIKIPQVTKDEALRLFKTGAPLEQVAERLKLNQNQVGGLVTGFKKTGDLPPEAYKSDKIFPPTKRGPGRPRKDVVASPSNEDDGFSWKAAAGVGDGFNHPEVTYEVERVVPPDGLLGRHTAPFTKEDVGRLYGSGRYSLTKFVPGQYPQKTDFTIARTYGPPRTPENFSPEKEAAAKSPAESYHQNPYGRNPYSPLSWRGGWPTGADKGSENSVIAQLVNKLSDKDKDKNDEIVLELIRQRTTDANKDKSLSEERMKDERTRWDQTSKDWLSKQQQIEKERDTAHLRELDRIRADQDKSSKLDDKFQDALRGLAKERADTIQALEKERVHLLEKQYEARENLLKKELSRAQQEMKDQADSLKEELKEGRTRIDREYDLREKAFNERTRLEEKNLNAKIKFEEEKLELVKKLNTGDSTNAIIDAVKDIATRAEAAIGKVTKVREMEIRAGGKAALDEDVVDGNISPDEASETPEVTPSIGNGNGNGKSHHQGEPQDMKSVLDQILKTELFQSIMEEWTHHIEAGNDSTTFANMFLEWMRDPRPEATETRQACSTFANSMSARKWPQMYTILEPHLTDEAKKIFEGEGADDFYEGFRFIVVEHIREYYREFVAARKQKQEESKDSSKADAEASTKTK